VIKIVNNYGLPGIPETAESERDVLKFVPWPYGLSSTDEPGVWEICKIKEEIPPQELMPWEVEEELAAMQADLKEGDTICLGLRLSRVREILAGAKLPEALWERVAAFSTYLCKKIQEATEMNSQFYHDQLDGAGVVPTAIANALRSKFRKKKCSVPGCGASLLEGVIKCYAHSEGWTVPGFTQKQWLYVECPRCHHGYSLYKLGIPKSTKIESVKIRPEPEPVTTPKSNQILECPDGSRKPLAEITARDMNAFLDAGAARRWWLHHDFYFIVSWQDLGSGELHVLAKFGRLAEAKVYLAQQLRAQPSKRSLCQVPYTLNELEQSSNAKLVTRVLMLQNIVQSLEDENEKLHNVIRQYEFELIALRDLAEKFETRQE